MTLEKPPTTLGENQFESSFLFLENAFTERWNIQKKFQQINYRVIWFSVLTSALENVPEQQNTQNKNLLQQMIVQKFVPRT